VNLLYPILAALSGLVLVPLTLLPIINPFSSAPVLITTAGGDAAVARRLARQVAVNSFYVIVASMLVGTNVLALFGISLPILRVGGGLLVCATAWRMLNQQGDDDVQAKAAEGAVALPEAEIVRRSFFPLTFPLTTGPGTIAASIALGAQIPRTLFAYLTGVATAVLGAALTAVILYVMFANAPVLLKRLGDIGTLVMTRLIAFILLCVGLQIMWAGWSELHKIVI
jgi:multiple antibiotic resistance protein